MRRSYLALFLIACVPTAGCLWQRKPPYANAPVLLHYKPTLSDSATILAEQQVRRGPVKPPMPALQREEETERAPQTQIVEPAKFDESTPLAPPSEPMSAVPKSHGPIARGSSLPSSSLPLRPAHLPPPPAPDVNAPLPPPPELTQVSAETTAEPEPLPPPEADTRPPLPQTPLSDKLPEREEPIASKSVEEQPAAPRVEFTPPARPAAAEPKPRRGVEGNYGHDDDYHWLQGVLERHHRGYLSVRYCDPSVEDEFGGKVRLQDDERLAEFHDGDVIALTGDLLRRDSNPLYAIRDVWLVRKK
jgi:hypothetical protein